MASTKIADVIVPEWFAPYVIQRTAELSALWQSGIVGTVAGVMPSTPMQQGRGGLTVVMPFWNDLTGSSEILSDTVPLSVDKITTAQDVAAVHYRGKAWGANDLAGWLSGDDPMTAIGSLVAGFWARDFQKALINTLAGVFASTSMSGNVHDISALAGALSQIGLATATDAIFKLGDAYGGLTGWAMHSATVASLTKLQLTETQDVEGGVPIVRFLGKPVIVDDNMPVATGTYTTYLFGQGAIGYDEQPLGQESAETDRDVLQGDDILANRRSFIMHPRGVKWVGTPAGVSPTNAELATGTNWVRVWENKQLRMIAFKHKLPPNA